MNDINFTDFKPTRVTVKGDKIGITRGGFFSFSSSFSRKNIGNAEYVVIRYDRERKIIGFIFTNDASAIGALKLTKKANTASFRSNSFWNVLEVDPNNYVGRYEPQIQQEGEKITHYIVLKEKGDASEEKTADSS